MDNLFETINKIISSPLWMLALYVFAFCVGVLWLALVFWTLYPRIRAAGSAQREAKGERF